MKNIRNDKKIDEFLGFLEKNEGNAGILANYATACKVAGVDPAKTDDLLMEYLGWSGEEVVAKYASAFK